MRGAARVLAMFPSKGLDPGGARFRPYGSSR